MTADRLVRVGAHAAAAALVVAAAAHVAWATGRRTGRVPVIPTVDGEPVFEPSTGATLGVAGLLAAAASLYEGAALGVGPSIVIRLGAGGAGAVLVARAIGDRRLVGLTKTVRDTPFARLDSTVLTPLCLALGCAGIAVAWAA